MPAAAFDSADEQCVNAIRVLAAEMVQAANSGHPGAPMGLAPLAHVLFSRHLRCDGAHPGWLGRDRFVLSNGHGCALLYAMLHLLGYPGMDADALSRFRQLHSLTPGHPEAHVTPGVEVTTGPLGQGVSAAVGLALAQAHMAAVVARALGADAPNAFAGHTYVVVGDGCLMEGVACEALSLAGHLKLDNLVVFWDDNRISIDGPTELAFSGEDVCARMAAYGFSVTCVRAGDTDLGALSEAIQAAKETRGRPSFVRVTTTIGFGSEAAGTEKVHGAPLGRPGVQAVRARLGVPVAASGDVFELPAGVRAHYAAVRAEKRAARLAWETAEWAALQRGAPELFADVCRRLAGALPAGLLDRLPTWRSSDKPLATRKASELVLSALAPHLPELVGGSADLTHSNLTRWAGAEDFFADGSALGSRAGRYVRFGVREHAMFSVCNGISAFGGSLVSCESAGGHGGHSRVPARVSIPGADHSTGSPGQTVGGSTHGSAYLQTHGSSGQTVGGSVHGSADNQGHGSSGQTAGGSTHGSADNQGHGSSGQTAGGPPQSNATAIHPLPVHREGSLFVPFAGTFLNFVGYGLGAVRLAALSRHHVLLVMTHDSIGLGEDGPTHQPVETLAGLRATPNLLVLRPADATETAGAYAAALAQRAVGRPAVLCLSRQELPHLPGTCAADVARGAYVVHDAAAVPDVVIIATGSEVSLSVAAAGVLSSFGLAARVVSAPCLELLEERLSASPGAVAALFPDGKPILSVEALATFGWERWAHAHVGLRTFGASAPARDVYAHFGITPDAIAARARAAVDYFAATSAGRAPDLFLRFRGLC